MKSIKLVTLISLALAANIAAAECSNDLPAQLIEDCIVVENSGEIYDAKAALADWNARQEEQKAMNNTDSDKVAMKDK